MPGTGQEESLPRSWRGLIPWSADYPRQLPAV